MNNFATVRQQRHLHQHIYIPSIFIWIILIIDLNNFASVRQQRTGQLQGRHGSPHQAAGDDLAHFVIWVVEMKIINSEAQMTMIKII